MVPDITLDPSNPTRIETASLDRPDGAVAESIRQIRTSILKACHEKHLKSLLVAAGMPGSGSTSIICNLAINAAAIDLNVLIIDANVRRPAVHGVFGLSPGPGLSEVLNGSASLESAAQSTNVAGLSVLTAGTDRARAYERFTTQAFADVMTAAKGRYDLVLVDCPPAVVSGDAMALAGKCDGVVLVVRAFHEKRGLVARLRHQLDDTRAEFIGVIVNAVKPSAGGYFKRNIEAATRYSLNGDTAPADSKGDKDDQPT
jgi:capsular exopolysaccharide synthesis family protein